MLKIMPVSGYLAGLVPPIYPPNNIFTHLKNFQNYRVCLHIHTYRVYLFFGEASAGGRSPSPSRSPTKKYSIRSVNIAAPDAGTFFKKFPIYIFIIIFDNIFLGVIGLGLGEAQAQADHP